MFQKAQTIVVVFHDFPLGGSERIAIRLMNRWAEMGRKVVAFCGTRQGPLASFISSKVEIVECAPAIPRSVSSRFHLAQALIAFLKKTRCDVVFAPGSFHWPILTPLAALPDGERPTVITQISTPLYRHGRGPLKQVLYNLLARYYLRCADATIALATATISEADRVLRRSITEHIRLPVLEDASDNEPLERADGNLIVVAGRLVKEKGFDVAIRAFAMIKDRTARLIILGDGPKRAELEELAASLGVAGRIEFKGYVPDITPWLKACRLFLLSSYYEGYGAVIVEALAAGRPVVSTDCTPAVSDLLATAPGCVVTPIGDATAMSHAIDQALSMAPANPRALAAAVRNYRLGPIATAHLDLFDRVHALKANLRGAATQLFPEEMAYV